MTTTQTDLTSLWSLRKAAGMKQTEVARLMQVSRPHVSRVEGGHHNPDSRTLGCYFAAVGRDDLAEMMMRISTLDAYSDILSVVIRRLRSGLRPMVGSEFVNYAYSCRESYERGDSDPRRQLNGTWRHDVIPPGV